MRRERRKGSVLILALALVAVLALVATAFIITARLESRAATNGLRGVQAEASCRSGLAAAIGRAQRLYDLGTAVAVYSTDSWHDYFYDASGPDLCADQKTGTKWVEHYDAVTPKYEMKAKRWPMPRVDGSDPAPGHVKQLKRTRGFAAEYYVAVADLDGKLRVNPKNWDTLVKGDDAKLKAMHRVWLDSIEPFKSDGVRADAVATSIVARDKPFWSLGQMRPVLGLTSAEELAAVESFLTVYPRKLADLVPANGRPAVNVNTARRKVIEAIVLNVPGFDAGTLAADVADKLVAKRPFANRKEMEAALIELGRPGWTPAGIDDKIQNEKAMNDLLNSLAGDNSTATDASDYDDPATSGYYHYDFDGVVPTGDCTSAVATATWGTEVKFVSRFYHIYVLGRTVADDAARRVMSERRLHAVYDAGTRRVLWLRWNHEAKANMGD